MAVTFLEDSLAFFMIQGLVVAQVVTVPIKSILTKIKFKH